MLIGILACCLGFHAITLWTQYFHENSHFKNQASVTLNSLVSLFGHLDARSARISGDKRTDGRNDRLSTVTLSAHALWGLISMYMYMCMYSKCCYGLVQYELFFIAFVIATSYFNRHQFGYSCSEMDTAISRRKHGLKQAYCVYIEVTHLYVLWWKEGTLILILFVCTVCVSLMAYIYICWHCDRKVWVQPLKHTSRT